MGTKTKVTSWPSNLMAQPISLSVPKLDPSTLILKEDEPTICVCELKQSPIDVPEVWSFGSTEIADIYRNKDISTTARTVSKKGRQILVKHESFIRQTDEDDANYMRICPMDSHVVLRIPVNEVVEVSDVKDEVLRLIGGLFQLANDTTRLEQLMRSQLRPL